MRFYLQGKVDMLLLLGSISIDKVEHMFPLNLRGIYSKPKNTEKSINLSSDEFLQVEFSSEFLPHEIEPWLRQSKEQISSVAYGYFLILA